MRLRSIALWLVFFGIYAATLGLHSFDASDYGGDEPHYLLTAKSLIDDGDFDVRNQRAADGASSIRSSSTATASSPRAARTSRTARASRRSSR